MKIINKETHVLFKDEGSFTSIAKKPVKFNIYQVFTTVPLTAHHADEIEFRFPQILVVEINRDKGFILAEIETGFDYRVLQSAINAVLYG